MAYALQGCGIVLRSDIEKRDKAYARVGRTAAQPVVSSLFIHSVWRRASYSLGSHIGANPQTFEPVSDPYLATFMEPQKKGANLRLAFLRSTQDKAGREAFQADAGYGLNFTVASNWKKAAQQSIFGKDASAAQRPHSPGREDMFGAGRDLEEYENELEAMWRAPTGNGAAVLRGKTAGDRRQMSFASDGNMTCRAYDEMDSRAFFANISKRGQTAPASACPASNADTLRDGSVTARSHGVRVHTLRTMDPLSDTSPFRRGMLRSRPSSAKSKASQLSRRSKADEASGTQSRPRSPSSARGQARERLWSAESGRASRPVSKGGRPSSSSSRKGAAGGGMPGQLNWAGSGASDKSALEALGRELEMPAVSFEEDPAAWYSFAQRCLVDGYGDLARRALRALEGDDALSPAAPDGGMNMREVFRPSSPSARSRSCKRP